MNTPTKKNTRTKRFSRPLPRNRLGRVGNHGHEAYLPLRGQKPSGNTRRKKPRAKKLSV